MADRPSDNLILVVDDETAFLESVRRGLSMSGFSGVLTENDPRNAVRQMENGLAPDLALIDVTMPGMDGRAVLERIRALCPDTECIMVTAVDDTRVAVECIRKGAYDYLLKPLERDDLVLAVNRALERKRLLETVNISKKPASPDAKLPAAFSRIITRSPAMARLLHEARLHARTNAPSLITGESGTGKELLATAIHEASPRAGKPFTPINMASLTSTLFDAEFFGHTKGAFTGAGADRPGHLATTHQGTLFLDEIGNLPMELQGKLLRVLQEGEYIRLGESRVRKVDIRFVAATNEDLEKQIAKGLFRKDLYYRLKGAWLHLPPLRERPEDIPLLVDAFLPAGENGQPAQRVLPETLDILMHYDYPGNVRELQSIVLSAATLAEGKAICAAHLPKNVRRAKRPAPAAPASANGPVPTLAQVEQAHIEQVYAMTGHNKAQTARMLGIGLNTLRRKLASYGVS